MGHDPNAATLRGCGHADLYRRVVSLVGDGGRGLRVLDLPAGTGVLTAGLLAAGHRVVPADLAPDGFCVPDQICLAADMSAPLPFGDGRFDVIACLEGIEHLQNPYAFMGECRRILRPGGRLILSTPNIHKLTSRLKFLLGGFVNSFPRPLNEHRDWQGRYGHIGLLSYYEARFMLHSSGFRILRVSTSHRKWTDRLFAPFVPVIALYTRLALGRERDSRQRESNREICRHMLSPDLLYGKHLVLVAERRPDR